MAKMRFDDAITVVSFHSHHLLLLNLSRTVLIDSLADAYEQTRPWAEAAFQQRPSVQRVGYTSNRNDTDRCIMLFEQRLSAPLHVADDFDLASSADMRRVLIRLADSQNINLV